MASVGILGFGLGGNGTIFMKVALSGLPQQEAGAGTGTYPEFVTKEHPNEIKG